MRLSFLAIGASLSFFSIGWLAAGFCWLGVAASFELLTWMDDAEDEEAA